MIGNKYPGKPNSKRVVSSLKDRDYQKQPNPCKGCDRKGCEGLIPLFVSERTCGPLGPYRR